MEQLLEKKIRVFTPTELERIVKEMEEHPFVYLGSDFWYSRATDYVYKLVGGKLQFVADYSK